MHLDICAHILFSNVKNHTVTQSSFEEPCAKLSSSWEHSWEQGFDSGLYVSCSKVPSPKELTISPFLSQFVAPGTPSAHLPTFEVLVNDTKPIWGYCQQVGANADAPTHCQSGMVFAINSDDHSDKSFDAYLYRAKASNAQNEPSATYSAPKQTHTIVVGGDPQTVGFVYTPSNITANPGDTVTFKFLQKNHTLVQFLISILSCVVDLTTSLVMQRHSELLR
jgi:plastocyanin